MPMSVRAAVGTTGTAGPWNELTLAIYFFN
jgi:hypothetical protein